EPFGAHVRPEPRLRDEVLARAGADEVGDDGGVSGGDVSERARVHERGVFSRVCRRLGFTASLRITAIAPAPLTSSAVIGSPAAVKATTIRASRARRSASEVASARVAITSEAAVMSNPVWRTRPLVRGPSPM